MDSAAPRRSPTWCLSCLSSLSFRGDSACPSLEAQLSTLLHSLEHLSFLFRNVGWSQAPDWLWPLCSPLLLSFAIHQANRPPELFHSPGWGRLLQLGVWGLGMNQVSSILCRVYEYGLLDWKVMTNLCTPSTSQSRTGQLLGCTKLQVKENRNNVLNY